MTESLASQLKRWRTGMHPRAVGMQVASIGRVYLQLGEALRVEMIDPGPGAEDVVHVQYYVATELGPWALWLSCARAELEACETSLRELAPPLTDEPPT
ncbi:MAG TPA: hypothetical protein VFQ75_06250 [Candidatus Limnocylindrales bacterium]|nr:hypothetical protein [Candidatus Limnocylindrales bacterium]